MINLHSTSFFSFSSLHILFPQGAERANVRQRQLRGVQLVCECDCDKPRVHVLPTDVGQLDQLVAGERQE